MRLTFLYPHLLRSMRTGDPAAQTLLRAHTPKHQTRTIATSERKSEGLVERHAKAAETIPESIGISDVLREYPKEGVSNVEKGKHLNEKKHAVMDNASIRTKANQLGRPQPAVAEPPRATSTSKPGKEGTKANVTASPRQGDTNNKSPAENVLRMPHPQSLEDENQAKPPHLQTPPYVHHFDTYTLVQQVEAGEFTAAQSITAMKAVRGLLAQNLEVAREGLVSKSDVENETYLFRAACSELRMEVQNNRRATDEEMRRERTVLQHETDILNQKLNQELLTLKDDLKGMFDDRKMTVRAEQRRMESKIQELNYKITVMLNSDSKSEVEGLRWVLTRRSVMGILFMAFMVLSSLRYASVQAHKEEERKKAQQGRPVEISTPMLDRSIQGAAEVLAANGG